MFCEGMSANLLEICGVCDHATIRPGGGRLRVAGASPGRQRFGRVLPADGGPISAQSELRDVGVQQ